MKAELTAELVAAHQIIARSGEREAVIRRATIEVPA